MVERNLAKVEVASSSLVSRSKFRKNPGSGVFSYQGDTLVAMIETVDGLVAEWLCSGLQIRVRRFDSDPGLHSKP
ncbi:hypothetical protein STPYR_11408 [uncultured Stenotrophomonas sp.]|uniref:Uncharacterized protein n=1 Tax=uncultured Stenotrophomonas sp. TaxID=165438 RepID=A0A1Y5Q2H8_9GAMM|nr:hypothetical protein STPYR_11408 [uncultured Stenotrophomonas sp.]